MVPYLGWPRGSGGVEESRTVQLLNALWPVKFGSRHINPATVKFQSGHKGLNPASTEAA
jgi:hypothetical protein